MEDPDLEHVVDCSAQRTAHAAFDRPLTPEQLARRQVGLVMAQRAEERRQRREAALERLRTAAAEHQTARDLLILLELDGEYRP